MLVIVIAAMLLIKPEQPAENPPQLRLKNEYRIAVHEHQIVLYENNKIIEYYPEIIVDNLPYEDRLQLEKGITAATKSIAEQIIEDFDG